MSIEIRGLEDVIDTLESLCSDKKIQDCLETACLLVERSARQKAPKGSSDLRRSIKHKVEDTEGVIYTPLFYAPYVEFGTGIFAENGGRTDVPWCYKDEKGEWHTTSGMHPMPFMRPALDENRSDIIKLFSEGLSNND